MAIMSSLSGIPKEKLPAFLQHSPVKGAAGSYKWDKDLKEWVKVSDKPNHDGKEYLGPVPSDGPFHDASLGQTFKNPRQRLQYMEKFDKYDDE